MIPATKFVKFERNAARLQNKMFIKFSQMRENDTSHEIFENKKKKTYRPQNKVRIKISKICKIIC